jgi:nucleotide-binding universal stress UspA family protein
MLKSLLLALDETPGSNAARGIAFALAKAHGAALSAIAVFDADAATPVEAVPVGAMAFKAEADRARLARAAARWEEARRHFEAAAREHGLAPAVRMATGTADATLCAATAFHDALVIGRDATMSLEASETFSPLVLGMLHHAPRPLIVAGTRPGSKPAVLVAYDGSVPAARTLQLFAQLGLAGEAAVHVLSIAGEEAAARAIAEPAIAYLAAHGVSATAHAVAGDQSPPEIILDRVERLGAGMVVMGVFGHRGIKERLLGSTTTRMLERCQVSLFLHH